MWAAGEKYMEQKESDPDLLKSVSIQLPRMSYDLVGFRRDSERQFQPLNKIYTVLSPSGQDIRYVPIPYKLLFQLYLKARNSEDAFKIIEQIIPYFAPFFSVKAYLLDNNPSFPVNFTLVNSSKSDQYEGEIADPRDLQWVLDFNVDTWLFGADIATQGGIIKWVNADIFAANAGAVLSGIPANGTYYEASNTYVYEPGVPIANIQPTDTYTIITDNYSGYFNSLNPSWILTEGIWNDAGVWIDTDDWEDSSN